MIMEDEKDITPWFLCAGLLRRIAGVPVLWTMEKVPGH
jgi:hypothetical protein